MRAEQAAVADTAPPVSGFLDRLGDRVQLTDRESGHVEVLRLRPELTASSLFEPAVRRRAEQLAGFHHPHCATVRQIGRLPAPDGRLVIVSDAVDGWRLSEVLEAAGPCGVAFHADAVLFLLRQLLDAVAALHDVAPGVSHGALGTERLIITADGRLIVTESVLGGALWHLPPMSPDRLWRDLRLAVADGEARPFGRRTDLRQIGIVALSLALGRQLRRDEYPTRLASLLQEWTPAPSGLGRRCGRTGPSGMAASRPVSHRRTDRVVGGGSAARAESPRGRRPSLLVRTDRPCGHTRCGGRLLRRRGRGPGSDPRAQSPSRHNSRTRARSARPNRWRSVRREPVQVRPHRTAAGCHARTGTGSSGRAGAASRSACGTSRRTAGTSQTAPRTSLRRAGIRTNGTPRRCRPRVVALNAEPVGAVVPVGRLQQRSRPGGRPTGGHDRPGVASCRSWRRASPGALPRRGVFFASVPRCRRD